MGRVFGIIPLWTTTISLETGARKKDPRVNWAFDDDEVDEAEAALTPILEPYNQDALEFFDLINWGRPPIRWAFVCLSREYPIADYIFSLREHFGGKSALSFVLYTEQPNPEPEDFYPKVGCLCVSSKDRLEAGARYSPLLAKAWSDLSGRDADRHWVLVLDEDPDAVLSEAASGALAPQQSDDHAG